MKRYQRYLSVLLCLALLFPVFSINVSAENIDLKDLKISDKVKAYNDWATYEDEKIFYSNDENTGVKELHITKGIPQGTQSITVHHTYTVELVDSSPIIKKGKNGTITLYNAYFNQYVQSTTISPPLQYFRDIYSLRTLVYYSDGTMKYYDNVTYEQPSNMHKNFTFEIEPYADVTKIEYLVQFKYVLSTSAVEHINAYIFMGEQSETNASISLEVVTEEQKLLGGIIEWLKGIKQGITDLFTNVKDGFQNMLNKLGDVLNSIAELPSKLWTAIENGLKKLFVPSDEYIVGFKEDMDSLLAERMGAVYEVTNITLNSWDRIMDYDSKNMINFPPVTVSLPEGNKFTFGGYDVKIVPVGFGGVADLVKTAVGIICTLAFINGLRKRYDEIMGVEQ